LLFFFTSSLGLDPPRALAERSAWVEGPSPALPKRLAAEEAPAEGAAEVRVRWVVLWLVQWPLLRRAPRWRRLSLLLRRPLLLWLASRLLLWLV